MLCTRAGYAGQWIDGMITYRDAAGLDLVNVDDALIRILARAPKILDRSEIRLL
jgi:hypothetical protein